MNTVKIIAAIVVGFLLGAGAVLTRAPAVPVYEEFEPLQEDNPLVAKYFLHVPEPQCPPGWQRDYVYPSGDYDPKVVGSFCSRLVRLRGSVASPDWMQPGAEQAVAIPTCLKNNETVEVTLEER